MGLEKAAAIGIIMHNIERHTYVCYYGPFLPPNDLQILISFLLCTALIRAPPFTRCNRV